MTKARQWGKVSEGVIVDSCNSTRYGVGADTVLIDLI